MVACAIVGCSRRTGRDKGVSMFSVPKVITNQCQHTKNVTELRRARWIERINRADLQEKDIKAHTSVCNLHFIHGKPSLWYQVTHPDWAPTLHLGRGGLKNLDAIKKLFAHTALKEDSKEKKTDFPATAATDQNEPELQLQCTPDTFHHLEYCEDIQAIDIKEEPVWYEELADDGKGETFLTNGNTEVPNSVHLIPNESEEIPTASHLDTRVCSAGRLVPPTPSVIDKPRVAPPLFGFVDVNTNEPSELCQAPPDVDPLEFPSPHPTADLFETPSPGARSPEPGARPPSPQNAPTWEEDGIHPLSPRL